jgi:hypothetical protein
MIGTLIGGLVGFVLSLLVFIAIMCIWGNTGRTANLLNELVQYKRIEKRLDPKTGKPLKG